MTSMTVRVARIAGANCIFDSRNHLRRHGQVTFILAIFIVYDDDHTACF
jgi:hypothetical protein